MKRLMILLAVLMIASVSYGENGPSPLVTPSSVSGLGTIATVDSPVPIANGGTGATTAAAGLAALGGATLNGNIAVPFSASTINGVAPLTAAEKTQALAVSNLDVFSGCATTSQSIPINDALTKIGFPLATDTAGYYSIFDPAGWQISSTTVRLPKTGYYQVNLNAYITGGDSGKRLEFLLMSEGYSNFNAQIPVGNAAVQSFAIMSCILKITSPNREVFVMARNNSTSAAVSVGYSNTRLSIRYLGGL